MENLYKIGLVLTTLFFLTFSLEAQDKLVVFDYSGEPFFEVNDSIRAIKKGSILENQSTITLNPDDEIVMVNKEGDRFSIAEEGTYNFKTITELKPIVANSNFIKNYFIYAWKEFVNDVDRRNKKSGVVYRGDEVVLMKFPTDSIRIYLNEISFSWDSIPNKTQDYYLHLKNMDTDKVSVLNTKKTNYTIKLDDGILVPGNNYMWAISETRFISFNKLNAYKFKLLSEEEFEKHQRDLKKLTKELLEMGMTKEDIKKSICEFSKFCY